MEKYGLTFPQKNIYFVEKISENLPINVISGIIKINSGFNEKYCEVAINNVIKYNNAMRIKIDDDENPVEYFREYEPEKIEIIDMTNSIKEKIAEFMENESKKVIDIFSDKLYNFKIIREDENIGYILMCIHHVISDAWSCSKIGTKLIEYYEKEKNKEEIKEELSIGYDTYINTENEYLNSDKYIKDEEFFKEYLNDFNEVISLKDKSTNLMEASRYTVNLDEMLNEKILDYCKENKVSVYALFLAALSTYIYRIKDKNDILIGTPTLNRTNFKEKNILGMFVSTLPMRIKINENEKFIDVIKSIYSSNMSLFRHQRYPYSKIVEYVHKNTDIKGKLYNIVLSYQNARAKMDNEIYSTDWNFSGYIQDELEIHIMDMDETGILKIRYDYLKDIFSKEEIEYLHTRIIAIIENAIDDQDVNVENIRIMSREEEEKILYEFNDTKTDYPKDKTVIELFEEQVEKTPDNVAIVFEGKTMTYRELYNCICYFASKINDIKGENIIVSLENSIELIVAIYGILMSGNCYVPIDIATPNDRIKKIAKDCNCKYAVSKNQIIDNVNYIEFDLEICRKSLYTYKNISSPNEIAYMIYTSGSTGVPKGVKIAHRSLVNYICWAKKSYINNYIPMMPLYSSIGFDLTVTTMYLPLISGGSILIYNNNSDEILRIFREDKVNIVKLTPAHLSLINEANISVSNIKTLIIGGEALKTDSARKIYNSSNKNISIYNEYGPTETTVGCMIYKYNNDKHHTVPIGNPADNVRIYVFDKYKRNVPIGIEGEMYIEGDCVSVGYNNLIDKNKECFIKNYKNDLIMYKTGDIGKLDFNLDLLYIGRKDKQIKINGNRIELEEIENIASRLFEFSNVAVDVKYISDIPNICLYYVSKEEYNSGYLKEILSEKLPHYMVPLKYVKVENIPLNKNGKVLRDELPMPENISLAKEEEVEYKNDVEKIVCNVWEKILNRKINPQDNIFDYGVDSLNIIRCQVNLSKYIPNVDVQRYYKYPIIRDFCSNIYDLNEVIKNDDDLKNYREIDFSKEINNNEKANNILLIGATGYLGIHILKELLLQESINNIYCIVRGKDYEKRLKELFEYYFKSDDISLYLKKVKVINGDIEKENLGLSKNIIESVFYNVQRVINAAAIVKHYGEYSKFEKINVLAVKNIINICKKYDIILEHISTISIAGDSNIESFDESKFYIGQNYKINPYIETKFEAEKYIFENIKYNNLKANVYRVGNLTWRYRDGIYQKNIKDNGFFMRIKNIIHLKAYPKSFRNMRVEMTPVDVAAELIIALVINSGFVNKVYHIYNPNEIEFSDMINNLGYELNELDDDEFITLLKSYDSKENFLLNDIISSIGMLDVKVSNNVTIEELKKYNKIWPILNYDYIKKICIYLENGGK